MQLLIDGAMPQFKARSEKHLLVRPIILGFLKEFADVHFYRKDATGVLKVVLHGLIHEIKDPGPFF